MSDRRIDKMIYNNSCPIRKWNLSTFLINNISPLIWSCGNILDRQTKWLTDTAALLENKKLYTFLIVSILPLTWRCENISDKRTDKVNYRKWNLYTFLITSILPLIWRCRNMSDRQTYKVIYKKKLHYYKIETLYIAYNLYSASNLEVRKLVRQTDIQSDLQTQLHY